MRTKRNTNQFINMAKHIHGDKYDYSLVKYTGVKNKIKIKCHIHGVFEQTPDKHINRKHGCYECGLICKGEKRKSTTEIFIKKATKIHNHKYIYNHVYYNKAKNKIKIVCKEHGIFKQTPNDHLNGNGCPMCRESKGEIKIKYFLENNNIFYNSQHRFSDCKYKKPLSFDFYLSKYNICIEFDGIQHYKEIKQWDKRDNLHLRQIKDKIKNDYCTSKNIKLIRIKYTNIDSITEILQKELIYK